MKRLCIAIDTQVFVSHHFLTDSPVFKNLMKLCAEDHVHLVLSDVTIKEIDRHISESCKAALNALKKFRKEANILQMLNEFSTHFEKPDPVDIDKKLKKTFTQYLLKTMYEVIECDQADIISVVKSYFSKEPPFGSGKKDEFPDAIALSSLLNWATQNNEHLYLASNDKDWKEFAAENALMWFGRIEEFVEYALKKSDTFLSGIAQQFEIKENDKVVEELRSNFTDRFDVYLQDTDGEVNDFNCTNITDIESSVVDFNRQEQFAIVNISGNANFSVEVSYGDVDHCYKDPDTKEVVYVEEVHKSLDRDTYFSADVTVTLDDDFKIKSIESCDWQEPRSSSIGVVVDDDFPYK